MKLVALTGMAILVLVVAGARGAEKVSETEKIEALIKSVEGLKDAKFVRNGSEHDGKAAAEHMRRKWKSAEREIKTARDFIRLAATKSSTSGEKYLIRFKDGKEVESGKWLGEKLDEMEKGSGGARERGQSRRAVMASGEVGEARPSGA